jgi:hypothetical protein
MEGMAIGTFPPLTLINLYFSPTKCPYNPYQEFGNGDAAKAKALAIRRYD